MKKKLLLIFACFFSSCTSKQPLLVEHHKIGLNSLASSYVGTPDPLQESYSWQGDSLLIRWNIPETYFSKKENTFICYEILTEKGCLFNGVIPLNCRKSYTKIPWTGFYYYQYGAILSFKTTLYKNDFPIFICQHPSWVDRIYIDP